MATSNTLLEIIASLQQPGALSSVQGRRILLDYARKRARARLGLLFLLDPAGQRLLLVEQCGNAPRRRAMREAAEIPVDGLFASALREQGLLSINESDDARRILPVERAWLWRGGYTLFCAVGLGADADESIGETRRQEIRQGVMVLCAGARLSTTVLAKQAEQDILLCAALLGGYLATPNARPNHDKVKDGAGESKNVGMPFVGIRRDGPAIREGRPGIPGAIHYPHILYSLATLYEIGLIAGESVGGTGNADGAVDEQALCRQVLDVLRDMLNAASGGLWLYAPSRELFVQRAGSGEQSGFVRLIEDELTQVAAWLRQERHGARVVTWSPGRVVVLHLLEYGGINVGDVAGTREVIGAAAFVIEGRQDISEEQRLLLAYGCRAAAAVIRGWQGHSAERQAIIDAERSRIARDIHDGAAQQITQAIHTLEYAGRITERQPGMARQEVGQARATLVESLNSLRQSIASLLPAPLERASLDEALDVLLDEFRRGNPGVEVHYEGTRSKRGPPSLEVPLYRLVQEALQNARKHARATQVTVQLQTLPGMVVVQVSDDGVGFDTDQVRRNEAGQPPHFGLRSMRERVEQVGGTFTLASKPGEGTTVKACFPLPAHTTTLTSRERDVLRLLVEGASNRAIAEQLSISVETVKSHMHHIMQKLGVKDRTQAAVLAARQQWV